MSGNEVVKSSDTPIAATSDAVGLRAMLESEAARRLVITEFIGSHLKEGVDYGKIPVTKGGQLSKPTLFKPGAEKFCSLMHLKARFRRDDETLSMLPKNAIEAGAIALVCELFSEAEKIVSEGRGICSVAEKNGQMNIAVKIAQKRALLDAVLRAFSISDSFNQDLNDPDESQTNQPNAQQVSDEEYASAEKLARDDAKFLKWGKAKVSEFAAYYLKTKTPFTKLSRYDRFRVFNGIIDTANDKRSKA